MTVTGIMTNPAATRAAAPVAKFAALESLGRADEDDGEDGRIVPLATLLGLAFARAMGVARLWRRALRDVK